VVGWADGPQQAALDSGWQHVLRSVFSQQAADGAWSGLDAALMMQSWLISLVHA